jgi:hypothetical protein
MSMRTRRVFIAVAVAGALAVPATAGAASPAQQCADAGGTFVTDANGVKSCQFPVGNSGNVKTTSQKGSFNSSQGETFTNPGGNQPGGQQGGNDIGGQ